METKHVEKPSFTKPRTGSESCVLIKLADGREVKGLLAVNGNFEDVDEGDDDPQSS